MSDLGGKLTALAEGILDELLEAPDAPLDQRIDALKAIGTLHLGLRKLDGKKGGDEADDTGPSMAAMRERIRQASEGGK